MKSRLWEVLKEAEAGVAVKELCPRIAISDATF